MADTTISDPIPAATLVLFRDCAEGPPELLIVERARAMAFAGGALVFPGGRIDPEDEQLAQIHPGQADAAPRIAAIREMLEEAGIAVGMTPAPTPEAASAIRAGLHRGEPFGALLAAHGIALDLSVLVPFARWRPRHANMRIFDTHFYIAALPTGAPAAVVDATENTRVFWASAAAVLSDADAGRAMIIFPTRRNLERLALFGSFADAVADARAHPVETITPWAEMRGGEEHLCIPEGLGYPVTSQAMSRAARG